MAQYPALIELPSIDGWNGFRIYGHANDWFGVSLSTAGDFNGDGFDDLLVAAPYAKNGPATYVIFGDDGRYPPHVLHIPKLDGTDGFRIDGAPVTRRSQTSVASAGDINGDGIDDLLLGASTGGTNGEGKTYVVFGTTAAQGPTFQLSSLDGNNGFEIDGAGAHDHSGFSVSKAGDINDDGFDDMIVGAHGADPNGTNSGASYVIFGKAAGFGTAFDLAGIDGNNGFKINGEAAFDRSGATVYSAGDVNGDGFADLAVGARYADPNGSTSGASYVVFGKASGFGATLDLSALDGNNGFRINGEAAGDQSGRSVSAGGDVNGDGFADVIVGAPSADPHGYSSGAAYVLFGKAGGFGATFELSALDGTNGFQINGPSSSDRAGFSVSSAGDMNGDGFDDVIVGTPYGTENGIDTGVAYVVFGKATGFGAAVELASLDGNNGFGVQGKLEFGWTVTLAGDMNGDGLSDITIGAPHFNRTAGSAYTLFGRLPDAAVDRTGTDAAQNLVGGKFEDTLSGLGGRDTLFGHGRDDVIAGGKQADTIIGGEGGDTLGGGGGADVFVYDAAVESTGKNHDTVLGVDFTREKFDLTTNVTGVDAMIATGALHRGNFDVDLGTAADAAHLGAGHAVLFTPDHGNLAGHTYLVVDLNGTAGYQAGEDLVIDLVGAQSLSNLSVGDFI